MTNQLKATVNSGKTVNKTAMKEGYLSMAMINQSICNESFHAENEAELNQYVFLTR